MPRRLTEHVHWLQECYEREVPGEAPAEAGWSTGEHTIHLPNNAYLVDGERTLLFDTFTPNATAQILEALEGVLGGRDLDYLLPSHPEAPHAGNARKILEAHPEATLLAPAVEPGHVLDHELYHLGDAERVRAGDVIDLGGPVVEITDAIIPDHPMSVWMLERTDRVAFTVDWLGFRHLDGECRRFVDELDRELTAEPLRDFASKGLFWFRFADPAVITGAVDRFLDRHDPAVLAPAHGLAVREPLDDVRALMAAATSQVSEVQATGGRR